MSQLEKAYAEDSSLELEEERARMRNHVMAEVRSASVWSSLALWHRSCDSAMRSPFAILMQMFAGRHQQRQTGFTQRVHGDREQRQVLRERGVGGQRSTPIRSFTSRQHPVKIPFPVQTADQNPDFTEEELKEFEQKLTVEKSAISRKAEELQKEKAVLQQKEEEIAQQRQQLQQVLHLKTPNHTAEAWNHPPGCFTFRQQKK